MGLGLLGAMGGLGDAGAAVGQTMLRSAEQEELEQKKMEWLLQRQEDLATFQEAQKDKERSRIGSIITGAYGKPGEAEGPPTEGGEMPKGPMTERQKVTAAAEALDASGYTDQSKILRDRLNHIDLNDLRAEMNGVRQTNADKNIAFQREKLEAHAKEVEAKIRAAAEKGSNNLAERKFLSSEEMKHLNAQSQFWKIDDELTGKPAVLLDAKGVYEQLIKKKGTEYADQMMSSAQKVAEEASKENGVLNPTEYKKNYLIKIGQIKDAIYGNAPKKSDDSGSGGNKTGGSADPVGSGKAQDKADKTIKGQGLLDYFSDGVKDMVSPITDYLVDEHMKEVERKKTLGKRSFARGD